MSNPSLHEAQKRLDALLGMIAEDGATPAGQTPPVEHIQALRDAPIGRTDEVRNAHAEGRDPPAFGGDR
jgi:hypothetical protein